VAVPIFSDNALRAMRSAETSACPEGIFLAWLLDLPDNVDVSDAATAQVVRLDQVRIRSGRGKRLRELFVAAAECAVPKGRVS
jgi:hypothetical protein